MNKYNFTEEEINQVLLSSPMALPQSPVEYGLKGNNIKIYFYDFIRKLMLLLNEHFILIKRDKDESLENHDGKENSHADIRQVLKNLMDKDVELGNAISDHHREVLDTNEDIRKSITDGILSHSVDEYAHKSLRDDISSAKQTALNALNSAQGKTKVYPVKNVNDMFEKLSDLINVGDRFVLSDKNVPDFTLFEKNSTDEDAVSVTEEQISSIKFLPGESYLYKGYLLVASESGIDTDLLVKKDDFELLEIIVSELDVELENCVRQLEKKLEGKETVLNVISESNENVILQNKTEHNLGIRTKANLILPDQIPNDFECIVNFRTGESGMEFTLTGVIMTQDDCCNGVLTPCKNRIYEVNIKNVDGVLIGKVGGCDYSG